MADERTVALKPQTLAQKQVFSRLKLTYRKGQGIRLYIFNDIIIQFGMSIEIIYNTVSTSISRTKIPRAKDLCILSF